jgi:hypothetical protein
VTRNSFASPARIALLAAVLFAGAAVAQDPQSAPAPQSPAPGAAEQAPPGPQAGARPPRNFPAPTNLKVLPKDLTGAQVREIMEGWAGDLGVHCDTCHSADPNHMGPNGRPRLNFASDEKDDKLMARIMYQMTEDDKNNYVARVAEMDKMDEPAAPLTCGTCHRGHLDPEKYTPPAEHPPQGAPGAMPGMQH